MAETSSSPATTLETSTQQQGQENPASQPNQTDALPASKQTPPPQYSQSQLPSISLAVNPNSNQPIALAPPPPPPASVSYAPPQVSGVSAVPPAAPSFRPIPQFSHMPNANYQNPGVQSFGVQPPGVSSASAMPPGSVSGGPGAVSLSLPSQPLMHYQVPPGQPHNPALRPYASIPNGYAVMPAGVPQGTVPHPGGFFRLNLHLSFYTNLMVNFYFF